MERGIQTESQRAVDAGPGQCRSNTPAVGATALSPLGRGGGFLQDCRISGGPDNR